jgi:hypothetical protein
MRLGRRLLELADPSLSGAPGRSARPRPGNGVSTHPDPPTICGVSRDLRLFIEDGPCSGQYTRMSAGPDGSSPARNPLVPRGKIEDGPTAHLPIGRSV